jgi:hypothetical protein
VCLGMPRIEEYRDPRAQEKCDGLDGRMMRLGVGIEDDVYLDAPLVRADQGPRQPRRIQEIGLHQNSLLGAPDALDDRVRRPTVGTEIDGPRGLLWAVARRSGRSAEPPIQPAHGKQADGDQPPPRPYRHHCASDMPCDRRPSRLRSRTATALSWGWTSVRSKAIPARPGVSVSRPRLAHRCALEE